MQLKLKYSYSSFIIKRNKNIFACFISSDQENKRPWYRQNDTEDRNTQAKKAYEVLMAINVRQSNRREYSSFSYEVKRRGKVLNPSVKYGEGKVSWKPKIV